MKSIKLNKRHLILGLFLSCSTSIQAQVPTITSILNFKSPIKLIPTNSQIFAPNPSVDVSSIGSCRYLILSLNGQSEAMDANTNISYYRNYGTNTNGTFTNVYQTNVYTNGFIPTGAVFIFPMNQTTKTVTSSTPVYSFINSFGGSDCSGSGVWNLTNGFALSYNSGTVRTNLDVYTQQGNYWNGKSNVTVSYAITNKYIWTDRYTPNSFLLYTVNNGTTWLTNAAFGSNINGFVNDGGQGNHDLTNSYYAALCRSNTNIWVQVYRYP